MLKILKSKFKTNRYCLYNNIVIIPPSVKLFKQINIYVNLFHVNNYIQGWCLMISCTYHLAFLKIKCTF